MNKRTRKLNAFLKKYNDPACFAAGIAIAVAFLAEYGLRLHTVAVAGHILAAILCGGPILIRAYQSLRMKVVGIEVLVSIAILGALCIGELHEASIVSFLFQFGTYLEHRTLKKTRDAIRMLTEMSPDTAWKLESEDAEPEEIDAEDVEEGDLLLVKTGGKVPVDGVIQSGEGYFMEASVTGESVPTHKHPGDTVYAGTILDSGTVKMTASRVGEDTTFARIVALVEEAQDAKSPAERFIDRFARWYTPFVVVMAAVVFLFTRNIDTAITILVLACPGALVIGAPVANVAGIGRGAREFVLLKGGESIGTFAKTDVFVFDKTGTLTVGYPEVTEAVFYGDREKSLRLAAAMESGSDHPLGKAILRYANQPVETVLTQAVKGMGIRAENATLGSDRFLLSEGVEISASVQETIQKIRESGASVVLLAENGRLSAIFGISDKIKEDAKESIATLRKQGMKKAVLLTGDHAKTAEAVAKIVGMDEVHAELLPEQKLEFIRQLQAQGHKVAFVGDGINDSPALAAADTGIAMGSGTDVAVETSDVVLIRSDLAHIPKAYRLCRWTQRVLTENIVIAVGTVAFLLAGLLLGYVHMASGMFVHEASILVVIFNAMRLLWKGKKL